MKDYWQWREEALKELDVVDAHIATIESLATRYLSDAKMFIPAVEQVLGRDGLLLWAGYRDCYSMIRESERHLTLIGYEAEVALSRVYATYLLNRVVSGMERELSHTSSAFKYQLNWVFDNNDKCTKEIQLNLDRVGVSLVASREGRTYEVFTEVGVHLTDIGIQVSPTRWAMVCDSKNSDWIEQLRIQDAVNEYLWKAENWPVIPYTIPAGIGSNASPYMEIVGQNLSVLSKSKVGRHAILPLLEGVPEGYDILVAASVEAIRTVVAEKIKQLNLQKPGPLHNKAFEDGAVVLRGNPVFVTSDHAIDFIVEVYWKSQGGDHPVDEWYVDLAGKARIRARFVSNGGSGHFSLTQEGRLYEVSAKGCWKISGICFGVGDEHDPFGLQGRIDQLADIDFGGFDDIPVDVQGAESIDCQVRADKAVFLVKMPRLVTIDKRKVEISSGNWLVSQLKSAIGVQATSRLKQVLDGDTVLLDDSSTVAIKGNEQFVSVQP